MTRLDTPRPTRVGTDLSADDRAHALAAMAPERLDDWQALAWLGNHLFVVTRAGRLDRRQNRPIAPLAGAAANEPESDGR